jgi:hypothetical protein
MNELMSPLTRFWAWITATGGLPGQMIFCAIVVCVVLTVVVWFSNRR